MRRLELDFVGRGRIITVWGVAVLVVGAVILGQIIQIQHDVAAETAGAQSRLDRLARNSPDVDMERADREGLRQEIAQANEILDQLTLPWDGLFQVVETSADKNVALLAIQPDVQKRLVRLSGEARNLKALLDYLARLEKSGVLQHVYLTNHEIKVQDPDRPVHFALVAEWVKP